VVTPVGAPCGRLVILLASTSLSDAPWYVWVWVAIGIPPALILLTKDQSSDDLFEKLAGFIICALLGPLIVLGVLISAAWRRRHPTRQQVWLRLDPEVASRVLAIVNADGGPSVTTEQQGEVVGFSSRCRRSKLMARLKSALASEGMALASGVPSPPGLASRINSGL